jgi:hypothetical protein
LRSFCTQLRGIPKAVSGEKQLSFCAEASTAAAAFATTSDEPTRAKAKDQFLELYWGRLAIVEDVRVAKAMIAYKGSVIDDERPPLLVDL